MSDEERLSQMMETFKNYQPDFDKLKIWGDRGQMSIMKDIKKLMRRHRNPYAWYVNDLKRKRHNRKQGRNLYKGILAYRQRVGQPTCSKDGLCFRGVATMYDRMRIMAIRERPELASRIPDLYVRYMNVRFPVAEFHAQMLGTPKPKPSKGIDFAKYGLAGSIIMPSTIDTCMITAGADAVEQAALIGDREDELKWLDAQIGFTEAMLRERTHNTLMRQSMENRLADLKEQRKKITDKQ